MKLALLLALALSIPAQDLDEGPAPAFEGATPEILLRAPTEWPAAEPARWADWTRATPPPEGAAGRIREVGGAYARGDLPTALAALYELLELAPGYPPALHQAGVIYFRLRRYGDAAYAFERYLAVQPERVVDTRALGHCYYTLGEYEKARAHYERVLAVEPESVETLRGYALCHMRLGDVDRALELLRRVVELEPGHANAHAWIAQILFDELRTQEALAAAERARDLDPFAPRPWFLLSQIHYDLGEDEAGEAAQARFELLTRVDQETRALEARLLYDPRQPELYDRLVVLHGQVGDVQAVRDALLRWLIVQPRDVALRIHVLDVLVSLEDARGAADAAEALAQVGADSADAWKRLARYYARTRQRLKQLEAERRYADLRGQGGG